MPRLRVPLAGITMASSSPSSLLLNPALSFCRVDGRHVFLDVARDRYFCLAGPLDLAFAAMVAGTLDDAALLARLEDVNLLVRSTDGRPLTACPAAARLSLVDGPLMPNAKLYPGLLAELALAKLSLRRRPLDTLLHTFRRRKTGCLRQPKAAQVELMVIAHTFARLGLFATTHDQCLPRSLALALYLATRGHAPDLVFGVRLNPFKAHCWIECHGAIVNSRLDEARHYTPVLRV